MQSVLCAVTLCSMHCTESRPVLGQAPNLPEGIYTAGGRQGRQGTLLFPRDGEMGVGGWLMDDPGKARGCSANTAGFNRLIWSLLPMALRRCKSQTVSDGASSHKKTMLHRFRAFIILKATKMASVVQKYSELCWTGRFCLKLCIFIVALLIQENS